MTEETNASRSMNAIEEGVVPPSSSKTDNGESGSAARKRVLSAVSEKYDVDHTGVLDSTQMAMRKMDSTNKGYISNEKVYKLLEQQHETQKKLLSYKRVMIVMFAFVVLLALAVLGTSFAAATLAKDTSTNNNVLVVKGSDVPVETDTLINMYQGELSNERRLGTTDANETEFVTTGTLSESDALEVRRLCGEGKAVSIRLSGEIFNIDTLQIYRVCKSDVDESIVDFQDRDGTLTGYNVTNPDASYDFQSGGDESTVWGLTVGY